MKEKRILQVFLIIGILVSAIFLYYNSNIFIVQKDSQITRKISIPYDGQLDKEVFLIKLQRNPQTPGAMDWVSFDNGEKFIYKTIYQGEVEYINIDITIPKNIDGGKYFIDYKIDDSSAKTIKFKVR